MIMIYSVLLNAHVTAGNYAKDDIKTGIEVFYLASS